MATIVFGDSLLELRIGKGHYGLSARRLWEHTELGQTNVFGSAISARQELNDAEEFIDVVKFDGDVYRLTGWTLADFRGWRIPRNSRIRTKELLNRLDQSGEARAFISSVRGHLSQCAIRRALRNQDRQFLPAARAGVAGGHFIMVSLLR